MCAKRNGTYLAAFMAVKGEFAEPMESVDSLRWQATLQKSARANDLMTTGVASTERLHASRCDESVEMTPLPVQCCCLSLSVCSAKHGGREPLLRALTAAC